LFNFLVINLNVYGDYTRSIQHSDDLYCEWQSSIY
jgi:hypothetical protein